MAKLGTATVFITGNIKGLNDALGRAKFKTRATVGNITSSMRTFGNSVSTISRQVLGVMTLVAGAGAAAGVAILKSAADYEQAFAGVRKTVDATEEEFAQLEEGLKDLSNRIPKTKSELAAIMEVSGQLGVRGVDNLLSFTEIIAMLADTTNLEANQAALQLARFLNITEGGIDTIDRIGSTIVDLGNNIEATESELTEMALRMAAAGKTLRLTDAEILGVSAALASVGVEAGLGGTAFQKMARKLRTAAESGGDGLQQMANVAGMSAEAFRAMIDNSPADALTALLGGLNGIQKAGGPVFQVLDDLGIKEERLARVVLSAAGGVNELRKALEIAPRAYEENTALVEEAQKKYNTFAMSVRIAWNNFVNFAHEIAKPFLDPLVNAIRNHVVPMLQKLQEWAESNKEKIEEFAEAVVEKGVKALEDLVKWYQENQEEIGKTVEKFGEFIKEYGAMTVAIAGAGVVFGPLLTALASVTTATVAVIGAVGVGGLLAGSAGLLGILAIFETFQRGDHTNFISRWVDDFLGLKDVVDDITDAVIELGKFMNGIFGAKDGLSFGAGIRQDPAKFFGNFVPGGGLVAQLAGATSNSNVSNVTNQAGDSINLNLNFAGSPKDMTEADYIDMARKMNEARGRRQ